MNLSGPFIRRPVATMLLSLAIMLLGGVSFGLLPVSPLPQMDFPVIVVSANLPGASPEVMASTVATPLAMASRVVLPKVSLWLGNRNRSALAKCRATWFWPPRI